MKKLFTFLLSICLVLVSASSVFAKVITQEKGVVTIPAGQVVNDDLFIGSESVDIAGTVNGDIYVGAGTVNFTGRVSGDLVVGAGTLNVNGGVIGDSLIVGAGTVNIDEQTRIGGSFIAGSGTIDNRAAVGRNLMIGVGNLNFNAPVGGEAYVGAGNVTFGSNTTIKGDLTYSAENTLDESIDQKVGGKVTRYSPPQPQRVDPRLAAKGLFAAKIGFEVWSFLGALVVGLVMNWLLSAFSLGIASKIQNKFLASVGWGLILLIVAPFALILLAVTGVGLPLAFVLGLLYFIDLYLAKIFASLALGKMMARRFNWKFSLPAVYFVGLVAYYVLRNIPILGILVRMTALLAGIGGIWLYKKQLFAKKK
jgi:hypothetical protein